MADALALVFAFWLKQGATQAQAQALTDLAYNETRGQHCAVSKYGDHWLYQWRGVRYSKLVAATRTRSCPPLEQQLSYAWTELHQKPFIAFWSVPAPRQASFLRQCFALGRC